MGEAELAIGLYLLLGTVAGLAAGLLGIGGGLIIVPALASLFLLQGQSPDIVMHLALGTSLATIVITSISSIRAHHRHRAIHWNIVRQLTPGILLGAWLGGWLAGQMTTQWLKPVFGLFELSVAIHMLLARPTTQHSALPGKLAMGSAGGIIGSLSAIVGIGGGTMTVPFLCWNSIQLRNAIATSAACGLPIAIAGALAYMVSGWQHPALPEYSLGYVHLPAFIGIIITSSLFAPLGARLTHSLPVPLLKKVFAVFLLVVGVKLLMVEM